MLSPRAPIHFLLPSFLDLRVGPALPCHSFRLLPHPTCATASGTVAGATDVDSDDEESLSHVVDLSLYIYLVSMFLARPSELRPPAQASPWRVKDSKHFAIPGDPEELMEAGLRKIPDGKPMDCRLF